MQDIIFSNSGVNYETLSNNSVIAAYQNGVIDAYVGFVTKISGKYYVSIGNSGVLATLNEVHTNLQSFLKYASTYYTFKLLN